MGNSLPYDDSSIPSILGYASLLLDKSLSDVIPLSENIVFRGKGGFGQKVEKLYFKYSPNSVSEPDFPKVGVEVKTAPMKRVKNKYVSKERLVFNSIHFHKEYKEKFSTSSFWKKNQLMLLLFFLYEPDKIDFDYVFKIIRLWRFPAADLKIIKDDWLKIVAKIKAGKAHELSEGDTLYLGACTKGANNKNVVSQPFSSELAMKRAFSLKSKYLNFIIEKSLSNEEIYIDYDEYDKILNEDNLIGEPTARYIRLSSNELEPVVKSVSEYEKGETFEDLVIKKFEPYYGMSTDSIQTFLGIQLNIKAKSFYSSLTKAILGISIKNEIEEFEKAEITIKAVRLTEKDLPKEDISFPTFKYLDLASEEWESSAFKDTLEHRFLFVFFQFEKNKLVLRKVKFWNMPVKDINEAEKVWSKTKELVNGGNIVREIKFDKKGNEFRRTNFPGKQFNSVAHVRPHATKATDTFPLPIADIVTKKSEYTKHCFWINNSYVRDEIYLKP